MSFLLPLLAGAALGGGGGSTSQQSTLTGTNSLQSSITPNTVVNIGGGVSAAPVAPFTGEASAASQAAIATPEVQTPLAGFPSLALPQQQTFAQPLVTTGAQSNFISDNLPLLILGAGALYFILQR